MRFSAAVVFLYLLLWSGGIGAVLGQTSAEDTRIQPSAPVVEALRSLPEHGNAALILTDGQGLIAVAVGSGRYIPKFVQSLPTDAAILKLKAVRAAVISAKEALAGQCQQGVATMSEEKRSDDHLSFNGKVTVTTERMILSQSYLWKSEVTSVEDGYAARAWIYFLTDATQAGRNQTGGLPAFATPEDAAQHIALWAGEGLCDDGELRLPIGKLGHEQLVAFGVGLASPSTSSIILARQKAVASLLRASGSASESIEGRKTLERKTMPDPLGKEGVASIMKESFFQKMISEHEGVIHPTAKPLIKTLPDGLTCCVVWDES